jgi:hypothetical protein
MDVNSLSLQAKQQIQERIGVNVDQLIAAMNVILHPAAGQNTAAQQATIQAARNALAQADQELNEAEEEGDFGAMGGLDAALDNLSQLFDDFDDYEEEPVGAPAAPAQGDTAPAAGGKRRKTIRRKTARRKGSLIGPLKKGELVSLGYRRTAKASSRHRALNKAIKKYGSLSTYRKLNAVAVYTKRTSPAASKTFKADRDWVGKKRS